MIQELYVFWRYDQFPYCLGGCPSQFKGELAYIPSYQSYFKPFLVTDKEYGAELKLKLDILEDERLTELKAVQNKYEEKLRNLIKIP